MASPQVVVPLLERFAGLAKKYGMYVILPIGEARGGDLYNSAVIFDRDGMEFGRYDKTHISQPEILLYPQIKAGNSLPTFDLDFGRIGIMTCYDCSFPEVAIIYGLKGVDVLFYPRWQSGPSEIFFEIQMRSRALDNAVFLVSSSFGVRDGVPWKPGMLFGRSCVIDRDGTILSDAGHGVGLASKIIDLDKPYQIECLDASHGEGLIKKYRELIHEDRRPELYSLLSSSEQIRRGSPR
jgi:predicted amidohydrolase